MALQRDRTPQLFHEQADQLPAERFGGIDVKTFWKADPGVADGEDTGPWRILAQGHVDLPHPAVREGVFEAIRDQLRDEQTTRKRGPHIPLDAAGL
jgi:hypothetical protein